MSPRFVSVCASFALMDWGDNFLRHATALVVSASYYEIYERDWLRQGGWLKSSNVLQSLTALRLEKEGDRNAKNKCEGSFVVAELLYNLIKKIPWIIILYFSLPLLKFSHFSSFSPSTLSSSSCAFYFFFFSLFFRLLSFFAKTRSFWILRTVYFRVPL